MYNQPEPLSTRPMKRDQIQYRAVWFLRPEPFCRCINRLQKGHQQGISWPALLRRITQLVLLRPTSPRSPIQPNPSSTDLPQTFSRHPYAQQCPDEALERCASSWHCAGYAVYPAQSAHMPGKGHHKILRRCLGGNLWPC